MTCFFDIAITVIYFTISILDLKWSNGYIKLKMLSVFKFFFL